MSSNTLNPGTLVTKLASSCLDVIQLVWIPLILCVHLYGYLDLPYAIVLASLQLIVQYMINLSRYHYAHSSLKTGNTARSPPPEYPFLIPVFGIVIPILWDHGAFVFRLSSYAGELASYSLSLLGHRVYVFQDPDSAEHIFKHPALASAIAIYSFSTKYLFGLSKTAHAVYLADNSGPLPKPHPRSSVPAHARIDHVTQTGLLRGLTGPSLTPMTQRFAQDIHDTFERLDIGHEWQEMPDFCQFFRENVGDAALRAIFGPTLFRLHPNFSKDLWRFDDAFPSFAKALPFFLMRSSVKNREKLVSQIKDWYQYARTHFDECQVSQDGHSDPIWGASMMRYRQDTLLKVTGQDDDSLARVDLGLAWATVANVILSTSFASFHIFKDAELLRQVRQIASEHMDTTSFTSFDPKDVTNNALCSSIYAETLRRYIKVYSAFTSPYEDISISKWVLPRGAVAMVNSGPAHMDKEFWNTKNGKHPVDSFWARRFIVDPADPESGPVKQDSPRKPLVDMNTFTDGKPKFSMEGCEGSWIPYGGGHSMCPGRFFAKNIIILTSVMLANKYDIEVYDDQIEFTARRYGIGVQEVKKAMRFRIRKRAV